MSFPISQAPLARMEGHRISASQWQQKPCQALLRSGADHQRLEWQRLECELLERQRREEQREEERQRQSALERWRVSTCRAELAAMLVTLLGKVSKPATTTWLSDDTSAGATDAVWESGPASDADADASGGSLHAAPPGSSGAAAAEWGTTTFMVRNIPPQCRMEDLLQDWPADGSYDFLHLPLSTGGAYTVGYAFINFASPAAARAFVARWQSGHLSRFGRGRRLRLVPAAVQGLEANVLGLRSKPASRLRARHCRPLIIKDGRLVELYDY